MKKADLNHFIEETSEQALKKLEEFFYSPDSVEEYISFLSQFYNYSPRNQLLIANQYKGAKAIAPYKKWQSLGAQVQKGEKAIKILVPSERKTFVRDIDNKKSVLPIKKATKEEKALMKKGEIKINKQLVFVKGSVFDIRQTDMPEDKYPQMIQQLRGEVTDYAKKIQCLNAIAEAYNIDVKESEDSIQGARGYYTETSTGDKKIILNKDNEQAENTRTMIHELSHALLHGKDKIIETPTTLGMKEEEFQAEMTALIVGSYMGLDNNDDSIQYIYGYAKNMSAEDKMMLMKNVQKVSSEMIKSINDKDANDIYLEVNKYPNEVMIKPNKTKNNTFLRNDQLYTIQDANYFSKEMYSQFTPTLAHQENNKTNIIQGIPFSYAPQQTMLEQPTFYEYVKTYIVSQDPSSKSKVDRAVEKDSQSIKHAQNKKVIDIYTSDNQIER